MHDHLFGPQDALSALKATLEHLLHLLVELGVVGVEYLNRLLVGAIKGIAGR